MLIDGGWPILDHDDDAQDFISQSLRGREAAGPLPAAAVLAFLGTKVAERARLERGAEIDMVDMITVSYPVYGLRRGDRRIALVETPVGAAAAVMLAASSTLSVVCVTTASFSVCEGCTRCTSSSVSTR